MDFLQNTGFKKTSNMAVKQPQSNDELLWELMSSSYHIEQKTFIEASGTNNIHTGEKGFRCCHFLKFVGRLFLDKIKKRVIYFGLFESSLHI